MNRYHTASFQRQVGARTKNKNYLRLNYLCDILTKMNFHFITN